MSNTVKRIKAGVFSGLWDALIAEPAQMMNQGVTNNPFAAIATNLIITARGGDTSKDAADTQFIGIINDIGAKLDKSLPPGPLGFLLKIVVLGSIVPAILIEGAKVYTDVNVKRPLDRLMRPELAPANAVIAGWRRGEFDAKERDARLATLGIPDDEMTMLVAIAEQNPQLATVLEWYHRGALDTSSNPLTTSTKGFEDFKAKAAPWLLRAGVASDDLANLYAAHWQLPGFQSAIEMLHRGLTDRAGVDAIMEQSALAPQWRDAMVKATYQLYPLRSIANMVHLGVLTEAQALSEYKAHGFDDDKAAVMMNWVRRSAPASSVATATGFQVVHAKVKEVTEGQLLQSYQDRLIARPQALAGLKALAYTPDEAELLLQHTDHGILLNDTRNAVADIKHLYVNGQVAETDARSMMGALKLPASFMDHAVSTWNTEAGLRVALPSLSDVLLFYKKGLLTDDDATTELRRIGIPDEYIPLYLEAHTPAVTKASAKA